MPTCEQRRFISPYHDGELDPEASLRLEKHLRECALCTAELERLRGISRLLGAARAPEIPADVLSRLHRNVGVVRESVLLHTAQRLTAVAAILLVSCVAWLWQAGGASPLPPEMPAAWETAAVTLSADFATANGAEPQLAQWIVEDLSRENGDD